MQKGPKNQGEQVPFEGVQTDGALEHLRIVSRLVALGNVHILGETTNKGKSSATLARWCLGNE